MNDDSKISTMAPEATLASAEGFTTLNISGENSTSRWGEAEVYRQQMKSGARWFYWIAGLSLINSIAALSNSSWSFLAGLGITQFISGFALGLSEDMGGAVTVIALILDVFVAGFFVLLGVLGMKGHTWAFMLGLVIYALDGLIFLAFQMWFPLAFHVFVVYCLYKGFAANRKLKLLEAEIAGATSGVAR
jgi:zinc transporter ZupT